MTLEQLKTLPPKTGQTFTLDQLSALPPKQPVATQPQQQGFLEKAEGVISKIFPGQKVGQAIGTLGGYGIMAVKEKLGLVPKGTTENYDLSAPSPLQVAGDVAKGAALIGGLKAPIPQAGSAVGLIGKSALQAGGFGALAGGGEAATRTSGKAVPTGEDIAQVGKGAVLGGAIGGVVGGLTSTLGVLLGKAGNKITTSVIKPSRADIEDGFSLDTIRKYNLGGSLKRTFNKTENTMDDLTRQLNEKLTASNERIDLGKVFEDTAKKLGGSKLSSFGSNTSTGKALMQLKGEINSLVPTSELSKSFISNAVAQLRYEGNQKLADKIANINIQNISTYDDLVEQVGKVAGATKSQTVQNWLITVKQEFDSMANIPIPDAQVIKRAAGHFGAWQYGIPDPESTARQTVYNAFYRQLKTAIEESSPVGVKEINKQLSDLIPIMNALIRRIPVAERNNILSLTDIITLTAGALNPAALGGFALNLASKSGVVGDALSKVGPAVARSATPFGTIGGQLGGSLPKR